MPAALSLSYRGLVIAVGVEPTAFQVITLDALPLSYATLVGGAGLGPASPKVSYLDDPPGYISYLALGRSLRSLRIFSLSHGAQPMDMMRPSLYGASDS